MNILGLEITTTGGKISWQNVRRFGYIVLLTWMIGIRFLNLNPFDDFGREGGPGFDTILDGLCLYGVWLINWHILWSLRPKFG